MAIVFCMSGYRRIRAILGVRKKDVPAVIVRAKSVYNGLEGHPALFPSPNPPLAVLLAQIEALDDAQIFAGTRARGAASVRDVKRDNVWTTLELLLKYVQSLCDASSEQAEFLIVTAGMKVAEAPTHGKAVLEVRQKHSGAVVLSAFVAFLMAGKGAKRVSFNWRYTTNGGETWIQPLSTPVGNITIEGLTPMTTVGFCVSVSTADGPGEWSQIVTVLIR